MKVISVNISQIKTVKWKGRLIRTGIFKEPFEGPLEVKGVNIVGDDQADRTVHGGLNKAIYSYPSEHYPYWKELYPEKDVPFGMFGENLTTVGMVEKEVNIGDTFQIGSVELIAVQPRTPCYKLGIKFADPLVLKSFIKAPYCGIYFKIKKEGSLKAGDNITLIHKDANNITVEDIYNLLRGQGNNKLIAKATELEHLPEELKRSFCENN